MEKVKTIVDREPVSSDYIGSKQNFGHVLSQVKNLKPPIWKTGWFYGPVGVAVIAITLSITTIDPISLETDKSKTTAKDLKAYINGTTPIHKEEKAIAFDNALSQESYINADARSKKEVYSSLVPDQAKIPKPVNKVNNVVAIEQQIENEPVIKKNKSAFSKTEEKPVVAPKNYLPHIEGYYTGKIFVETLCSERGIQCNDEIRVIAFKIQYFTGSKEKSTQVVGNKIPPNICDMINKYNVGNMIFITDIKGVNEDGEILNLLSLNYEPTK